VFPEPTPLATSSEELPPLEIGSVTPSLRISDGSLGPVIAHSQDPGMAASLRITEQARIQLLAGKVDDAIRDLTRALSVDPSDPYAYLYLGRAYLSKRNNSQAMTFFKRAEIGFGSGNPMWLSETLAFEGLVYEEEGHATTAVAVYQQALRANPGNLMARVGYTRLAPQVVPAVPTAPGEAPSDAGAPPAAPEEPPPPPPPSGSHGTDD